MPSVTDTSRFGKHRGPAFQFGLRHLFWATMVLAVYLALLRAAGEFVGTLVIGVYIIWCVITLMRIDNLVWGGIVGACLATAILVLTGLVCCPPFWAFVASGLVYPTLGYPLGILCAGCKQIDAC